MKREEKAFFVANLAEEIRSAQAAVLVNFSGMNVKLQQELKKRLSEAGAKMMVVKNTLFKLAGQKAKVPNEALTDTVLQGQTALIVAEEDPLSPLQVLVKFAKEFEIPQLKAALIEGDYYDKQSLLALAKLPSKQALFSQAVGAVASPLYGLTAMLQANLQNLIFILSEASQKQKREVS